MDAGYLHGQQFLGLEQMVEIGFGINLVGVAAVWVDGGEVALPFLVAHVHRALIGEEHGVAPVTGGHHTVKHVYSSFYCLQNILGSAYTHEVAGLVGRQNLIDYLYHLIHDLGGFTYCQTANGIAVGILVGNILGCIAAQFLEGTTLYDREKALLVTLKGGCLLKTAEATIEPSLGELKALLGILIVALTRGTLVESHDDVSANDALCIHYILWSKDVFGTINVGAELATFFTQFANASK